MAGRGILLDSGYGQVICPLKISKVWTSGPGCGSATGVSVSGTRGRGWDFRPIADGRSLAGMGRSWAQAMATMELPATGRYHELDVEGARAMTPRSEDKPSKTGPPRWALIYMSILGAVIVWGGLVALHGYRQWWVVTFYGVAAAGIAGGSIKHKMGSRVPLP